MNTRKLTRSQPRASGNGKRPAGAALPPELVLFDEDAERLIAGAILFDPDAAYPTARAMLDPGHIYTDRYRWLFEVYRALRDRNEPINFGTVTAELDRCGRLLEIGGPAFVAGLDVHIDYKRDVIGIEDHARRVHSLAARRALLNRADKSATMAYNERIDVLPSVAEFTDLGNSRRLAIKYSDRLRYVGAWGWLVWDGMRWARDETGEVVRLAREIVRGIFSEAQYAVNDDTAAKVGKWAVASQNRSRIEAMIILAQSEPEFAVRPGDFDRNSMLLNVANGIIDLRTGELRPHNAGDLITKIAPMKYDPNAECPTWQAFLDRIFDGNTSLIDFLQRAAGYSLTGDTGEQCLFLCYGTGANGKSTFLETLRAVLGDYAQVAEFSSFLDRRGDTIRNDIARMAGARCVTAVEAGEGKRLAEVLVKTLTGGDTITARFLHREHFEFRPQFKAWLAANHKPVIRGTDWAIWRRIRLVPFTVTIPEAERDPHMADKLRAELPGILAWAVRGVLEWQRSGLQTPDEVTAATAAYRTEQDVIAAFIDQCCVTDNPNAEAKASDLYAAYKTWAEAGNEYIENQRAFGLRLTERGFERRRGTSNTHMWRGIGLVE